MSLPDREAVGVGLGESQFSELELFARIDEAVDRDPAFFVIGLLSFVTLGAASSNCWARRSMSSGWATSWWPSVAARWDAEAAAAGF